MVTAQRRSQRLQDVAVPVSAYGGLELRMRQVQSSIDIARMTPGVSAASSFGGQAAVFSIRGVTQNDYTDGAEGPVAVYVDDAYLPNVQAQSFGLFDLDRVEVLKGPQGTLFGRNSTGGLVQFVVAKPTEKTTGFLNASYGAYNQAKVEGALSGSLAENVQGRASIYYNRQDGWLHNLYPGGSDLGGNDDLGGRLQIQAEPTDRLTLRLSGSAYRSKMSSAPFASVGSTAVLNSAGSQVGGYLNYGANANGYVAPSGRSLDVNIGYSCSSCAYVRAYNGTLHADYDAGWAKLSSITSFTRVEKSLLNDLTESPAKYYETTQRGGTNGVTQEFRATGQTSNLVWNTGLYYINIHADSDVGYIYLPGSSGAVSKGLGDTGYQAITRENEWKNSASLFGQLEYKFAPKLTAVVGGRFIHEWLKYGSDYNGYAMVDPYEANTSSVVIGNLYPSYSGHRAYNMWAGKVSLEYRPIKDTLLYAGINRGVKGAGFNDKAPSGSAVPASERQYNPETLVDYEGGAKTTLWGGLLTLDSSIYYYDYKNYQAYVFLATGAFIYNDKAETYGGELQANLRPMKGLDISLGGSYNHATVKNVLIAPNVYRDTRPSFAPRTQLNGRVSYTVPGRVGNGSLMLAVDGYHSASSYANIRNFVGQRLPGYTIFGAQASWTSDSGLSVTVSGSNIFDKRYLTSSYDLSTLCGCSELSYGKPQWWNVTLGYKF